MNSTSKNLINQLSFCVFDLETTGGNHETDKIIEIGLIKIENLRITQQKSYLIRPEIKIPFFIQKLTSISHQDVKKAPLIEDVIKDIVGFMGDSILVAHNSSFDVPFFNSVLHRLNLPSLKNKSICTNLMTRHLIPNLMNSNLNYMCRIFEIKHDKAHRALEDAKAAAGLLLNYLHIFIKKDIQKINHLYYPRNKYELDRTSVKKGSDHSLIMDQLKKTRTPYLCTIKGINGVILFSFPCANTKEECLYIEKKLKILPWKTMTIRLFGPFLEAFLHFSNNFTHFDPEIKKEVCDLLWKIHLPEISKKNSNLSYKDMGDFVITNHLVPDQLIILPLSKLHHKSSLIFRYPDHEKKLLQYIQNQSKRIGKNSIKETFDLSLTEFIHIYLNQMKKKQANSFFFPKALPLKQEDSFLSLLDTFVKKNPNTFNYPKEYI